MVGVDVVVDLVLAGQIPRNGIPLVDPTDIIEAMAGAPSTGTPRCHTCRLGVVDDRRLVKVSKYLAKHLRHRPERLGLTLDRHGWVAVDELLTTMAANGMPLTRADLDEVVARNDKRRYAYDDTGHRIRASQGHSVEVDLGYEPSTPPDTLYHGTVERSLPAIMADGLRPQNRHHVHLSGDIPTARAVGARRGRPVVLAVDAAAMHTAGTTFQRSANEVWLVAHVPPQHLRRVDCGD